MNRCESIIRSDLKRYGAGGVDNWRLNFIRYLRLAQHCDNRLLLLYYRWRLKRLKESRGIEIYYKTKIGKGLYLGHPYGITINSGVEIGNNCNLHKGVTIGQENRGRRKGVPILGNLVFVGINATIVGKIRIGDDVLIAQGAYVNVDVPSHSIVIGNPCIIKHCDNATEGYINNIV